MKASSVLAPIGNNPHRRVNRLFGAACQTHQIHIKSGHGNRCGSIGDRSERALSVEGFLP